MITWKFIRRVFLVGLSCGLPACQQEEKQETPEEQGKKEGEARQEIPHPKPLGRVSWEMTRGGADLSGQVGDLVPQNPEVSWTFETDAPILGEAVVSGGVVVFGNDQGVVYALDLQSGAKKWEQTFEDSIEATPAISGQMVFVGCQDSFLYALDLQSGEIQWKYETDDKITAGVNLTMNADGSAKWLLLNGYDGVCRVLEAESGAEVWSYETDEYINGTPAIIDGKWIVFGGCDRVLYTLDLATGAEVSKIETEAEIVSTVATLGDFVTWGTYGNEVLGAEVSKAKVSWVYRDRQFPFMASPAVSESTVYAGCRDKKIHAISRKTGKGVWKYKTRGRVESAPILFHDALVCGSNDGRLYALTLEEGELLWKLDLGESIVAAPSFADGFILVGSEDGTLFAVK